MLYNNVNVIICCNHKHVLTIPAVGKSALHLPKSIAAMWNRPTPRILFLHGLRQHVTAEALGCFWRQLMLVIFRQWECTEDQRYKTIFTPSAELQSHVRPCYAPNIESTTFLDERQSYGIVPLHSSTFSRSSNTEIVCGATQCVVQWPGYHEISGPQA